ncbi:MAG TPA: hypothetical protein VJM46_01180, partial [Candidatus Saccharimonadales bacterium]|nr:hypothetical protein [Candidatus Saccharimonadales bacterium]
MPRKRLVITLVIVVILAIGGYFVYQQISSAQQKQTYEASSDKVADDFLNAVIAQNPQGMMATMSTDMRSNYSEGYWKTSLLTTLQGYKGWPTQHFKGAVQPASADVPNRYDERFNQQATLYQYDFKLDTSTYRLSI